METLRRLKNRIRTAAFRGAERYLRVHVTPVHYYSPIPEFDELDPGVFTKVNECPGLQFREDRQLGMLQELFPRYAAEYVPPVNTGLAQVDALVLYTLIRRKKPKFMVEIGSGESTKISLAALARNADEGAPGRLTAIEPYPRPFLKALAGSHLQLIEKKVQDVELDVFREADILFIDSSHVARIGSDVNYEMFEVVPRLKPGALVHWHDIMIPVDYSRSWVESGTKFWNESYVVQAFMLFNDSFETVWASRYMQVHHPERLRAAFPYFKPEDPEQQLSSFWIERVR